MFVSSEVFTKAASTISQWLGVTSTLVATATAIFTTQLAVSVNESNARDRFFEKQLQACMDLGDASIPLQRGLTEIDAGFYVQDLGGHKDVADAALERGAKMVDAAYDDYRKIADRLFVLYPDSYLPLQGQIIRFTPTTLQHRAENEPDPKAAFKVLRDGFTTADLKLRQTCTTDLRRYAKTYLMDRAK